MITPATAFAVEDFWGESSTSATYDVEETPVSKEQKIIKDIEIHGLNVISPDIVMQRLNMQRGDAYSRDILQADLKSIYELGYFTEKMKAIPVNNNDGSITLKIILEENAPVTDFTIEGNTVIATEDILEHLLPMKGKPQNITAINDAIVKIQNLYTDKGYILARVESVTDDPDGTVNITLKEGTIDKIMIAGNEKTKDYIIERNILTEPGMVYNENLVKEDLVRLYATQAFKDVTREIEPSEENPDAYDITIKVEEQRSANLSVGGGVDSVTGLFGSVGIADNNFKGRNERLALNVLAGTGVILNDASIERRMNLQAELSYYRPYFFNADSSFMSKIYYRDFGSYQVPLAIERRIGGEVTVAHRMKFNKHMTSTFSLGAENVHVSEGNFGKIANLYNKYNVPISERAKQLDGGLFLSLSPAMIYDTRDSATVTRRGTMASLRFDEEIGLDGFDKTHGDDMPDVMAYRLGGPYTIRGFKMSGVGTGEAFVMGSAEFATPIPFVDRIQKIKFLNNVRFTMFVDAGKIFNNTISDTLYDRPGYAVTAGVGLKLYIPGMGPLSVDYGIPLTNPGVNGNENGYFTFGVGDLMY